MLFLQNEFKTVLIKIANLMKQETKLFWKYVGIMFLAIVVLFVIMAGETLIPLVVKFIFNLF